MFKPLACLIFLSACWSAIISQNLYGVTPTVSNGQSKEFLPSSPTSASLGIFGQVPVGNYTGTAEVLVPFYTVNYRELNVPIGISYHAEGNKPDIYPGIVGLGWALNAGGAVTRVVKGYPDYQLYPISSSFIPVVNDPISASDWSSTTKLNNILSTNGFANDIDKGNPDEFLFNFNGVSGKFYMDYTGTFKVKTNLNTFFSVNVQTVSNKTFTMPSLSGDQDSQMPFTQTYVNQLFEARMIYQITITDDHGVKYIFGGTDNSIEFSRPGIDFAAYTRTDIDKMVTPMTWQLTSITSPNGYTITFDYERAQVVTKAGYSDVTYATWTKTGSTYSTVKPTRIALGEKSTFVSACYLTTITTPKEILHFSSTNATAQLQFPHDPDIYAGGSSPKQNSFFWYKDIGQALGENYIGRQLNTITINDASGTLSKSINFNYTGSTNTRLKLLSVYLSGNDNKPGASYSFDYNPLSLPPYLSYQTDYYGYYNGHNTYITSSDPGYYRNNVDPGLFFQSKAPDPNYVQAEMLTKITYPTGGFTQFVYEPNDYGVQVQTWPFTTVNTANTITGGVRVKQVISYTGNDQKAVSKRYYYTRNYLSGGTVSSGVLAYLPTYYDIYNNTVVPPAHSPDPNTYNGTLDYWQWSSNPIFPLGETKGHHITYSEVTEVNDDGGATVYKYKNYDNGYNDVQPVNQVSDNTLLKEFWKEDDGTSMDLERGQLLSEEYYDAAGNLKKKKAYEYNNDPARFDNNVRVLSQASNSPSRVDIPSIRVVAKLFYTYFPYLSRVTQTEYEDGGQPSLESIITYEYDNNYRAVKKKQTTSSDGRTLTELSNYPQDMVLAGVTDPYQDMVNAGMVGVLVSSEHQSNGLSLSKATTAFDKNLAPGATLMLPQLLKTQFGSQPEEVRMNFNQYDIKGNLVSQAQPGGITTCYVWSYNYTYPIAKIANASYTTVVDVLGGQSAVNSFASGIPTDNSVSSFLQSLRTDSRLSQARVTTYTYNMLFGVTSETDPNQRSMYYEYDFMGRLSIVRDHDHNILKKICYNYTGLQEDCGVPLPYNVTNFGYSTSSSVICNPNGFLQSVTAYSKKPDPENPFPIVFEYFSDQACTIYVPDGYYKIVNPNGTGGAIYYIVNGSVTSFVTCH